MYSIRKFADCWAVFNLDTNESRPLTADEVAVVRREIPSLDDPGTAAYYTDELNCISEKP
ncbi:MAG TPA: hypothetical protein VMH27_11590 [Puia sp.]|nr:hypothetical protein [Puia sp.]